MLNIGESTEGLPSAAALISGGARVQRTVLLRGPPPLGGSPSLPGAHTAEQNGTAASANGGGGGAPTLSPPAPVASSQQGPPLVYAVSWWRAQEVDVYLSDRSKPIWVSLSQGHVELYREVRGSRGETLSALPARRSPSQPEHQVVLLCVCAAGRTARRCSWCTTGTTRSWSSCWAAPGRSGAASTCFGTRGGR